MGIHLLTAPSAPLLLCLQVLQFNCLLKAPFKSQEPVVAAIAVMEYAPIISIAAQNGGIVEVRRHGVALATDEDFLENRHKFHGVTYTDAASQYNFGFVQGDQKYLK